MQDFRAQSWIPLYHPSAWNSAHFSTDLSFAADTHKHPKALPSNTKPAVFAELQPRSDITSTTTDNTGSVPLYPNFYWNVPLRSR